MCNRRPVAHAAGNAQNGRLLLEDPPYAFNQIALARIPTLHYDPARFGGKVAACRGARKASSDRSPCPARRHCCWIVAQTLSPRRRGYGSAIVIGEMPRIDHLGKTFTHQLMKNNSGGHFEGHRRRMGCRSYVAGQNQKLTASAVGKKDVPPLPCERQNSRQSHSE